MILETDLTTLDSAKAWIGIPLPNTSSDAVIAALISACSGDFLRATNRPDLLSATYTEVRQGDGSWTLTPFHWPIASVSSLVVAGKTISNSSNKIAPGWYIDEDLDPELIITVWLAGGLLFTDVAAIQLDYTAGYPSVPPDIEQAINDWVAYRYKQSPMQGQTQRKSTEGESVQQQQVDAPANTLASIERYRRRIPSVARRYDHEQRAEGLMQKKARR